MKLYSIHDSKACSFNTPFWETNNHTAVRGCVAAIQTPGNLFGTHSTDFDLYLIGEFNTETGIFKVNDSPIHVISFTQLLDQAMGEADNG